MDPPRAVSVFKLRVAGCCFCFFFRAVKILMNEHLIWVFREIVVLLNNLDEGRNVDTISDCMINNELDQMNLYFLFSFKSFKQLIFLCSNNATGYIIELISYFLPLKALTRSGEVWMSNWCFTDLTLAVIENEKNFFMKKTFLWQCWSYADIYGFLVRLLIIFFLLFLTSLLTCYDLHKTGKKLLAVVSSGCSPRRSLGGIFSCLNEQKILANN